MLGVQDHCHVKCARLALVRRLAVQHRQEILGVRERRIRRHRLEPLTATLVAGDDRRQLRDQPRHRSPAGLRIDLAAAGIREGKGRDSRAEHLHRRRLAGRAVDQLGGGERQLAVSQVALECRQRVGGRQLPVEQ